MIVVATPTRAQIEASTASDIAYLLRHSPDTEWALGFGSIIANNRTLLVHTAAKAKASHILFIDADMRLPKEALERLLAHKKDIVGVNYKQRTRDEWTARKGETFIDSTDTSGIEPVDTLGFGVLLINMNVFLGKLRSVPPNCFAQPFDQSTGTFVGEDVYFCTVAKEAGFTIWVDHDLSHEIKHIGSIEL
jgi:hypothetical protein